MRVLELGLSFVDRDSSSTPVLIDDNEGPFSIWYQPMERTRLPVTAMENPYPDDQGMGYDPYEVTLLGADFVLVTVVTPDDGDFSSSVIDGLARRFEMRR